MSSDVRAKDTKTGEGSQSTSVNGSSASITITEATSHAPKGRIVEDPARGTLFWEADVVRSADNGGNEGEREFSVEWLSTMRIPFYQTRGLRNGMNHK